MALKGPVQAGLVLSIDQHVEVSQQSVANFKSMPGHNLPSLQSTFMVMGLEFPLRQVALL